MIDLQKIELEARIMAHGCNVYSSNKDSEHDQRIKATRSSSTSAACGIRWMSARDKLESAGLKPLAAPVHPSVGVNKAPIVQIVENKDGEGSQ
mgnify:CR=1 FL=1